MSDWIPHRAMTPDEFLSTVAEHPERLRPAMQADLELAAVVGRVDRWFVVAEQMQARLAELLDRHRPYRYAVGDESWQRPAVDQWVAEVAAVVDAESGCNDG